MPNFQGDQAAGLRRIMAKPQPRIISVLSTMSMQEQQRLICNLAASLQSNGCGVLMVDTTGELTSHKTTTPSLNSLHEIPNIKMAKSYEIQSSKLGFPILQLTQKDNSNSSLDSAIGKQLNQMFDEAAQAFEIVLVTTVINESFSLPLTSLNQHEIIIQVTRQPDSIKSAYTLIKQICNQLGRRSFGIIVENATDAQAEIAFRNIAQVTKRFMQVELEFFGAIPNDEQLDRATNLGRTVIDAFPLASASYAFKKLAKCLEDKQTKNRSARQRQAAFI